MCRIYYFYIGEGFLIRLNCDLYFCGGDGLGVGVFEKEVIAFGIVYDLEIAIPAIETVVKGFIRIILVEHSSSKYIDMIITRDHFCVIDPQLKSILLGIDRYEE